MQGCRPRNASQVSKPLLRPEKAGYSRFGADKFENIRTSSPILFVGNTADPTTPLRKYASSISLLRKLTILLSYVTALSACRRPSQGQACSRSMAQAIYPIRPPRTVSAQRNGLCRTSETVRYLRMGLFVRESRRHLSSLRHSYDQFAGFRQC